MPRFNLIFHGMMLFEERKAEQDFRVIIPHVGDLPTSEHTMLYGDPAAVPGNPKAALYPLIPGTTYTVTGPKSGTRKLLDMVSPQQSLILDGSKVKAAGPNAQRDVIIIVPKPVAIRRFRCLEVFNLDIMGSTSLDLVRGGQKPFELADAYCFVYTEFQDNPAKVRFHEDDPVTLDPVKPFNLCVYSQRVCEEAMQVDRSKFNSKSKLYHAAYRSMIPHETAINRLLSERNGSAVPFDLRLSMLGHAEPAYNPGENSGLTKSHLMNLPELFDCPGVTDPTGCSPVMLDGNG